MFLVPRKSSQNRGSLNRDPTVIYTHVLCVSYTFSVPKQVMQEFSFSLHLTLSAVDAKAIPRIFDCALPIRLRTCVGDKLSFPDSAPSANPFLT
ncbi:hypothetical protein AVEN_76030-1 [Araneus ventricosus]|uniref:Uncharacterized protein n=1 Tax=Araneus ventricosus TaxID=182803 RepID=A0A4Y2U789_ARAVE|nr:hypothetical protein AVEN_76030-1 [Araneus ventricosus]